MQPVQNHFQHWVRRFYHNLFFYSHGILTSRLSVTQAKGMKNSGSVDHRIQHAKEGATV